MRLVLPYPPTLNNLKAIVRGRMVKTSEARKYEATVQWQATLQGAKRIDGPLVVRVRAFRPRKAGDLDNTLKAAFDALKGVAWNDDSQVVEIYATRHDDKANPRLEVEVDQYVPASAAIGVEG